MQLYHKSMYITGKARTEFMRSILLEQAAKFLTTTHKSVKEIISASGFSNKAYFYREFQRRYCKTPGKYRGLEDSLVNK